VTFHEHHRQSPLPPPPLPAFVTLLSSARHYQHHYQDRQTKDGIKPVPLFSSMRSTATMNSTSPTVQQTMAIQGMTYFTTPQLLVFFAIVAMTALVPLLVLAVLVKGKKKKKTEEVVVEDGTVDMSDLGTVKDGW